jgi:hypothetical protein
MATTRLGDWSAPIERIAGELWNQQWRHVLGV